MLCQVPFGPARDPLALALGHGLQAIVHRSPCFDFYKRQHPSFAGDDVNLSCSRTVA